MTKSKKLIHRAMPMILGGSLVKQIIFALLLGIATALMLPDIAASLGFLGSIFVSALKAVAPILVFILVLSAIANQDIDNPTHIRPILVLYMVGTFFAALSAVTMSFIFPVNLQLAGNAATLNAPGGISEVLRNLILSFVDNPVHALLNGNYIGILAWAIGLGVALRKSTPSTRQFVSDFADGIGFVVRVVIRLAPIGIFGLVSQTLAAEGLGALVGYAKLLCVLVGAMALVALLLNPLMVWVCIRKNPYPLTIKALLQSGITAFFTRSSAANIPVNMQFCKKLELDEGTYGVSIPLGATINMAGAAITITVLTLAACTSLGIQADFFSALLLSLIATLCACGAAGVPGGSLMLIPLACGLFGIDNSIAMQVVAIGFIIGVVQDSCETALNSSSDALFTAAACLRARRINSSK